MSNNEGICLIPKDNTKGAIHFVLSHSYFMYLLAIVLGLILDRVLGIGFSGNIYSYVGVLLILTSSMLVYWAQYTSSCTSRELKKGIKTEREFARGPYKWTRNPTHIGLSVMTLGLGFIMGSPSIVFLMVFTFILTKIFFLKKEEELLELKYGQKYCEYKQKVKTWL